MNAEKGSAALSDAIQRGDAASYAYFDLTNGERLHHWISQFGDTFAIGNGPIEYIEEDEFLRRLKGVSCKAPRRWR